MMEFLIVKARSKTQVVLWNQEKVKAMLFAKLVKHLDLEPYLKRKAHDAAMEEVRSAFERAWLEAVAECKRESKKVR